MTTLDRVARFAGVAINGHSPIMTRLSRNQFPVLFASLGFRAGAEIGVWCGEFAEVLCRGMTGLRLLCVDPWQAYGEYHERKNDQGRLDRAYAETRARLEPFTCVIERRTSLDAARLVADASLDFVFIDANHRKAFVLDDLAAWTPKVRAGGIIAGHDYGSTDRRATIEVKDAVDEYTLAHGIAPVFVAAKDKAPSFFWVQR